VLPTPLVRARGLERVLACGPIYVKRDDLTGFGVSGNKARPLEFLIGDALAQGADVLVAAGAPSSNFCAAAALAARTVGLDCDLLFPGPPPTTPSVNVELARAAGARLCFDVVATREELDAAVVAHAESLLSHGRQPYAVPRGGATAVGASGFACAAKELAEQAEAIGITPEVVVVATGSGGTQAWPGGRAGGFRPAVAGGRGQRESTCGRHVGPRPEAFPGLRRRPRSGPARGSGRRRA